MISWREKARSLRAWELSKSGGTALAHRRAPTGAPLARQVAFAESITKEVLIPVLKEFAEIVSGAPAHPVYHHYNETAFGVTCDLDSRRFTVKVYLLPSLEVRIAVFLTPSSTEGHCRDYRLVAPRSEIEEWLGDCLARLYENR
jgi:hypothetical protein